MHTDLKFLLNVKVQRTVYGPYYDVIVSEKYKLQKNLVTIVILRDLSEAFEQ